MYHEIVQGRPEHLTFSLNLIDLRNYTFQLEKAHRLKPMISMLFSFKCKMDKKHKKTTHQFYMQIIFTFLSYIYFVFHSLVTLLTKKAIKSYCKIFGYGLC